MDKRILHILSCCVIGFSLLVLFTALMICLIYDKSIDGASLIIGFFINLVMLIGNYIWGSSDGSKSKEKALTEKKH